MPTQANSLAQRLSVLIDRQLEALATAGATDGLPKPAVEVLQKLLSARADLPAADRLADFLPLLDSLLDYAATQHPEHSAAVATVVQGFFAHVRAAA